MTGKYGGPPIVLELERPWNKLAVEQLNWEAVQLSEVLLQQRWTVIKGDAQSQPLTYTHTHICTHTRTHMYARAHTKHQSNSSLACAGPKTKGVTICL